MVLRKTITSAVHSTDIVLGDWVPSARSSNLRTEFRVKGHNSLLAWIISRDDATESVYLSKLLESAQLVCQTKIAMVNHSMMALAVAAFAVAIRMVSLRNGRAPSMGQLKRCVVDGGRLGRDSTDFMRRVKERRRERKRSPRERAVCLHGQLPGCSTKKQGLRPRRRWGCAHPCHHNPIEV